MQKELASPIYDHQELAPRISTCRALARQAETQSLHNRMLIEVNALFGC